MLRQERVNEIIHRILREGYKTLPYFDGTHYCTFTRPDNHIIYECRDTCRDDIVRLLRIYGFKPIENDKWCGGRRIGIIVNGFYDEIGDDEV